MVATLKGRLQTKLVTYVLLALVTAWFAWTGGEVYLYMFLIAAAVGLVLETIWGIFITWQPGWLTFLFAGIEFLVIANVAAWLGMSLPMMSALRYYLVAWALIQLFLLYVLPIWRMSWNDNGAELW